MNIYPLIISITPTLELRAAIVYSYVNSLGLIDGYVLPMIVSFLIIPIVYMSFDFVVNFISSRSRVVSNFLSSTRTKVKRYVDRYGLVGLTLFVAVPLPGSGLYTGTLGALLLGMKRKDAVVGLVVGNMLSMLIVLFALVFFHFALVSFQFV